MIEKVIKYYKGYVFVRLSGLNIERFLNMCKNHCLNVWNVKHKDNICSFYIEYRDMEELYGIEKKTSCKINIAEKCGIPFLVMRYAKRVMFFGGIILFFSICYEMSTFVWNISLEGNYSYTEQTITKYLQKKNICHGMKKKKVNCEKIEKIIRNKYDDITWVSAELKGTKLIIHIKENFDRTIPEQETSPYNILSGRKAVISSIVTRSGTPMVKAGDKVDEGTELVSGMVDIYGDDGTVIETNYVCADADVFGEVIYSYEDSLQMQYIDKVYTGKIKNAACVEIGGMQLCFAGLPIKYKNFDRVCANRQAHIFENFYLPFYLETLEYREYTPVKKKYTIDEGKIIVENKLQRFLDEFTQKGIQIIQNNVKIDASENMCCAKGTVRVIEQLGEVQYITEEMKTKININQEGNQNEDERD